MFGSSCERNAVLKRARVLGGMAVAVAASLCISAAVATPIVYPAGGQSRAQQATDERECRAWAQDRTGFDPTRGVQARQVQGQPAPMVRGAATGAALGAVGGAIGGNAGRGAAIGAGVGAAGGLISRGNRQMQQQSNQRQAVNQFNSNVAEFNRAFSTCMRGRGYSVG